jgi:hypothetical protein
MATIFQVNHSNLNLLTATMVTSLPLSAAFLPSLRTNPPFRRPRDQRAFAAPHDTPHDTPTIYDGPILGDPNEIVAGFSLAQLGLDVAVAPSAIAPGTFGLYVALSEGVETTTTPAMELLCGYSREGSFQNKDTGDKTVGFSLAGPETAVFYDQQLMSVLDALELAAKEKGDGACGLAGHVLVQEDETGQVDIHVDTETDFKRYYVPSLLDDDDDDTEISVQNLGQFCNDLAWSYSSPPGTKEEYDATSLQKNAVQLVWRLEYDPESSCLVPTWPVSVLADDIVFKNSQDFMELGTKYGWGYWQATVDIESLN